MMNSAISKAKVYGWRPGLASFFETVLRRDGTTDRSIRTPPSCLCLLGQSRIGRLIVELAAHPCPACCLQLSLDRKNNLSVPGLCGFGL